MFNAKRDKIIELEKEIDFHKKVAGVRQDKLVNVRLDCERLRAEVARLTDELIEVTIPVEEIRVDPLNWIEGEPREQGWYFVAWKPMPLADTKTTALFYNPAARCKWMRGEKGNAERFEQEVIAYIEAPEYEN
jgi:hypothetical protein